MAMRRVIYQTLLKAPFQVGSAGAGIAGFIGSVWPEKVKSVIGGDTVTIQGIGIALLAFAALYFLALWLLKPGERDKDGGITQTTHGSSAPAVGVVHGDFINHPPPAPVQERKSPYGSGYNLRNLEGLERAAR